MPKNNNQTSQSTINAKMRAAKALELRMEGMKFDDIAAELGYSGRQGAYDAVSRELKALTREPAEEVLRLDLERLDKMWGVHYLNAQAGDAVALSSCMRIMERRSRLLGLDAPAKSDHTSSDGSMSPKASTDPEVAAAIAKAMMKEI